MPAGLAAAHGFEHIILLPIRFGAKSLPGSCIERWSLDSPAAIWQVFKIQFTVVRVHRRFQRADGVEALYDLITTWARDWLVGETNTRGVSAFQEFALMTDLSLFGARSVHRRSHAQDRCVSYI